jgi:hypothetical protein
VILEPQLLVRRLAALATAKRLMVWGVGLLAVSWFIYVHTISTPGLIDRIGRFKGTDYIQFYVAGSLVLDHRTEALFDPHAHLAEGRRRIDPELKLFAPHPNYGPQVALLFAPFALLPFAWSLVAFLVLSTLCYAASVWLLWRECDALRRHAALLFVLAVASPLFLTVIRYGQASAVSLLIWSAAFVVLRRSKPFVAGLCVGCLAFKPQLGIVLAIVFISAGEWRVVAGAAVSAAGQLAIGWLVAGTSTMARYFETLWMLARDPGLVQLFPSENHSIRGFLQLLAPRCTPGLAFVLMLGAFAFGVRMWRSDRLLPLRWSALVLLTILASPHLLTYDLLLLTIPLILVANWAAEHDEHPLRPSITIALVLLYFASFSGNLFAMLTHVQVSVVVMSVLTWRIYELTRSASDQSLRSVTKSANTGTDLVPKGPDTGCQTQGVRPLFHASRAMVAPRWDAVSSQNSTTSG